MASTTTTSLLLISFLTISTLSCTSLPSPPIINGLSYTFYSTKCPNLPSIIRTHLKKSIESTPGLAPALLRLHFHDCFVQGCDASLLLDGPASEQTAPPNLSLRSIAFKTISSLRSLIDKSCGPSVASCADLVAIAARDSVALSGGPNYKLPLGRRDGLSFATQTATLAGLPSPASNVTTLLSVLTKIGLDASDLVALSGGHTIGLSHCTSFTPRLYPNQDTTMDKTFAKSLRLTCPKLDTNNTTVLDIRSPKRFDNKYYVDLLNRQTLFTSDQDLYTDKRTRGIVESYAVNQTLFFERFGYSMVKMGMIRVLTGNQGEIRSNCSVRNTKGHLLWPVDGEDQPRVAEF